MTLLVLDCSISPWFVNVKTNARYQIFVLKETMKKQDRCSIQKVKKNSTETVECYHQPGQLTPYQPDTHTP